MLKTRVSRILSLAAAFVILSVPAEALINPNFTPVDLVEQSGLIAVVRLGRPEGDKVPLRVVRALKGKAPGEALTIDLTKTQLKAHAAGLRKLIAAVGTEPALLFISAEEFRETGDEENRLVNTFLHLGGKWIGLSRRENGMLDLDAFNTYMDGTWNGGTDMLQRAVGYVLTNRRPDVPVDAGTAWGEPKEIGKLGGEVHELRAVALDRTGRLFLFAAAESGDRLWRYDSEKKTFADVTKSLGLTSRSHCAAWGDFDADGRLDLASWNGKRLELLLRNGDGAFKAVAPKTSEPVKGVLSLAALDVASKHGAGLVAATGSGITLLVPQADKSLKAARLEGKAGPGEQLGQAGPGLVADLDGDRVTDMLHLFEKGSVYYRGRESGRFQAGVACAVTAGPGPIVACTGDYDADGLLDIFTGAKNGGALWHNRGEGRFAETLRLSGEFYKARPRSIGGATCDINHDGRQDLVILYRDHPPQTYFNRGFRAFGYAIALNDIPELLPEAGQQAGLVADLDGNGSQDLVVALPKGGVWLVPNALDPEFALGVRAALPPAAPGPVTVVGWSDKGRCLGAWNVSGGGRGALFGMQEPGECVIEWRFPGKRKPERKKVVVEEGVKRVLGAPPPSGRAGNTSHRTAASRIR